MKTVALWDCDGDRDMTYARFFRLAAECSMGFPEGQGTAGAGSWGVMTSFDTVLFSSGVTKSIGSMTVFFKRSIANCASPVTPVAKDFIGIYFTSASSIEPLT